MISCWENNEDKETYLSHFLCNSAALDQTGSDTTLFDDLLKIADIKVSYLTKYIK